MVQLDPHSQCIQPCDISLDGYDIHLGWRFPWGRCKHRKFPLCVLLESDGISLVTADVWIFLGVVGTHSACLALMPLARGLSLSPRGNAMGNASRPQSALRRHREGQFPVGAFIIIIIGVIIGDFA